MTIFLNCFLQIDTISGHDFFSKENITELVLLVLAVIIPAILIWVFKLPAKIISLLKKSRNREKKGIWKFDVKSKDVKPGVHLNITNFKKAFFDRDSCKIVKQKFIDEKKNLIIVGRSGIGKTRSTFEILSKSKKHDILIPFLTRPDSYEIKNSFKKRKRVILFIDDLQKYNTDDINFYLENLIANSNEVQLLCTCRTEHEASIYSSFQISNLERYELNEWSDNEGKTLANLLMISFDPNTFDHTPASIIYKLAKLKEQYKQLKKHQLIILECIKLLKTLELDCNSDSIKEAASQIFELDKKYLSYDTWRTEIKHLTKIGFYDIGQTDEIIINDIYLSELIDIDFYSVFTRYYNFLKSTKNSSALFYCGLYLEKIGDFTNAEKCYKEAIVLFPNYGSAIYGLGSLYLSKADKEEKVLNLKPARKSITSAIEYLQNASKIKSTDYSYQLTLGYAYSKSASIFDKLGDHKNETTNHQQAIDSFNKAIELNEKSSGAYRMRGFCYFKMKNSMKAKDDYEIALKLNPNSHQTYYLLGMLYNDLNNKEKALGNYKKCIELKKDFFQAYNDIGHILSEKPQESNSTYTERMVIASEAIKNYLLSIRYSRGKHIVAYSNLGHLYIDINEIEKAIKVQTIAIKKSPNYGEAYSSRGYAFNRLHKYEAAEADLLKALKLNPHAEKTLNNLALCYQQWGAEKMKNGESIDSGELFKKAIQSFDKLIASPDNEQKLYAKLGKAITLERMGKVKDAFDILNKLFSEDTSNSKVLSTLMRHLVITNNDEQILSILSLLLKLIKEGKIQNISKELMEECTLQIQRLSKNKMLSNNLQELIELLKITYPNSYYVYKTSGVYNLNKGITQLGFETKMNSLSEAEKDFNHGKSIVPNIPVFLKYIGVVNTKKCALLKEKFIQINHSQYINQYNDLVGITKKLFSESEKNFPEYPELRVEHSIFLYTIGLLTEGQKTEKEARSLLEEQREKNIKSELQITEELKELEELKSKLKPTSL